MSFFLLFAFDSSYLFIYTAWAKGEGNGKRFDVVVFFTGYSVIMKLRFVTVCYCQLDFVSFPVW